MKYSKSSMPYLSLLFIILIGLPIVNHHAQKTQRLIVEVEKQKSIPLPMVHLKEDDSRKNVLLLSSTKQP